MAAMYVLLTYRCVHFLVILKIIGIYKAVYVNITIAWIIHEKEEV